MNTYHVYLRKGGMVLVTAAGYTEDKRARRFFFHTDLATKNKATFFCIADVAGIHAFEIPNVPTVEDLNRYLEELPKAAHKKSS